MNRICTKLACLGSIVVAGILGGCAGAMSDLIVPVSLERSAAHEPAAIAIEVSDLRRGAVMRRTTIGQVSMGTIALEPPEAELIRQVVAAALGRWLADQTPRSLPQKVSCGIMTFDVATPVTLLYWDVTTDIELIIRAGGADRLIAGKASERTYLWPSGEIIGRVTARALREVADQIDRELPALLAATK